MSVELDNLSLQELKNLRARVERAISGYEDRRKREALAAAEKVAREHGFNLAELTGAAKARGGKRGGGQAPRYAHPDNPELTWGGRGRRPQWVAAALESGKSLEDLAI